MDYPEQAKSQRGLSGAVRSDVTHDVAGTSTSMKGGWIVDGIRHPLGKRNRLPSIPLFVVLVSGAMGGFVSALQRIQSSPTEGDSVYNLSLLYHGSYAVFVSPLTRLAFC